MFCEDYVITLTIWYSGPCHNGRPLACHASWCMNVAAPAHHDQGDEGVLVRQLGRQAHGAQDQEDPRRPGVCLQVRGIGSVINDHCHHHWITTYDEIW